MFKVKWGNETRIFRDVQTLQTFEQLQQLVTSKFQTCPPSFYFTYQDQDADQIVVQDTLDIACFLMRVRQANRSNKLCRVNLCPRETVLMLEEEGDFAKMEADLHEDTVQNEIQVLQICQDSCYEEIYEKEESLFQELAQNDSEQAFQNQNQEDSHIADLLRANLHQIQQKCIQNVLAESQNRIISDQVEVYLEKTYRKLIQVQSERAQIMAEISKKEQIEKNGDEDDTQEITEMIQRSLRRQLPSFIQELTRRTIMNVKDILHNHTKRNQSHIARKSLDITLLL